MSRFLLFFICLLPALAGMWAGTEKFAALIHFDPVFLGEPIVGTLYAPWSIFKWYARYRIYVPRLFSTPMVFTFLGFVLSFIFFYLCKPKQILTSHGSAHWASYRDLLKMDLISAHGCVIGLYDSPFKRAITSFVRSVENVKKEKVSFAEMHYDQKLQKKITRKENELMKLESRLEMVPKNQVKKRHLLLMKVRRKVGTQGMQRIP